MSTSLGIAQYIGSFALVVALLVGLLWALKRLQGSQAFARREQRLRVVESLSLGARMKVALVRVDGREVLVGVTPAQITPLGSWRAAGDAPSAGPADVMASGFPQEPRL